MRALAVVLIIVSAFALIRGVQANHYFYDDGDPLQPKHWGTNGEDTTIGIVVNEPFDPQWVANVAASWSVSSAFDLVVVGMGDGSHCVDDHNPGRTWGYIELCPWESGGGGGTGWTWCVQADIQLCNDPHLDDLVGAYVVFMHPPAGFPDADQRILCHELGHALKLNHGGGGCVDNASTCPSVTDIEHLDALYAHTDAYVTSLPAVGAYVGVNPCVVPTATPTPTPTLFCQLHPDHKKCR